MKKIVLIAVCAFLASCGGSDGGSVVSDLEWQEGVFASDSNFRHLCETPRVGNYPAPFDDEPYPDMQGSLLQENNWLRSFTHDKYLWYQDIVDQNPANFSDPVVYFQELKSKVTLPSGRLKDEYSFSRDTYERKLSDSGISLSYGIRWVWYPNGDNPDTLHVGFVEKDSPAALAGILRGDRLIELDNATIYNTDGETILSEVYAARFPSTAETHDFVFLRDGERQAFTVTADTIDINPIDTVKVLSTSSGNVGYIHFTRHIAKAQDQWISAINELNAEGVTDLVLDMRYNGGGRVDIASRAAYMIAGYSNTDGKIFNTPTFNDKHVDVDPFTGYELDDTPFYSTGFDQQPLPSLNLNRVFVLTRSSTCSASELVMNSLRGIGVEVIQIGTTTCGKPYGFYGTDNCGTSYYSVNLRASNNQRYGDYAEGFSAAEIDDGESNIRGCKVFDDITNPLGDVNEARLAAALYYRDNGSCPLAASSDMGGTQSLVNHPIEEGVLLTESELETNMFMQEGL